MSVELESSFKQILCNHSFLISNMKIKTPTLIVLTLKLGVFLTLSIIFYVHYFTEVAEKYAEKNSYLSVRKEELRDGVEPPAITFCLAGPIAKLSVLKNYNISLEGLDEPSIREKNILISLNKTILDLYREATFALNRDFELYMTYSDYGLDGDKFYEKRLSLG